MLKEHPRGLFILSLANMGERFGYYTMLAIFTLYLQAKFGFSAGKTSMIFGTFLACVYFLPLLGGILADRFLGYGKTIMLGILIMFGGYLLLAVPMEADVSFYMMVGALGLISLGTGFFKGNLQALVGNLYDEEKYKVKRDVAYSIFYMCINIGAFFAPSAAEGVSNFFMAKDGFKYEASVPALAVQYLNYKVVDAEAFKATHLADAKDVKDAAQYIQKMKSREGVLFAEDSAKIAGKLEVFGKEQLKEKFTDSKSFARSYLTSLTNSYNYGFGVACFSLILSLLVFVGFRKYYKHVDITEAQKAKDATKKSTIIELTPEQTKERLIALGLVFLVVIFFWMSFHQNGATMTYFARDYTVGSVSTMTYLFFSLASLVPIAVGFYGLFFMFQKGNPKNKIVGAVLLVVAILAVTIFYQYISSSPTHAITPPKFQQFNPFFIILLTPIFVSLFAMLNKKGKEPSAPRKIGIGMLIAAAGFCVLIIPAFGLKSPSEIVGVSETLISPYWLVQTYFVLTIAELFLSPMGISFVSKVAPPKYKGLMQGGWLCATAIGNYLVGIMGILWEKVPLWVFWGILVTCCLLSAAFIFSILNRLERATKNA